MAVPCSAHWGGSWAKGQIGHCNQTLERWLVAAAAPLQPHCSLKLLCSEAAETRRSASALPCSLWYVDSKHTTQMLHPHKHTHTQSAHEVLPDEVSVEG